MRISSNWLNAPFFWPRLIRAEEEYTRLVKAAKTIDASPFLEEKIILSVHTGLRRGSLFHLRWDHVDFLNRVLRIPRTKSGRPHAMPLNGTVLTTLQALHTQRLADCPFVFAHASGRMAGRPVQDVKNAFHTALELAEITDFTWHDLRHTFASWLIMKGASLRSVAELLGHRGLRMVMRYAHLSPAYLSAEVSLLDAPEGRPSPTDVQGGERARKGQRARAVERRERKASNCSQIVHGRQSFSHTRPDALRSSREFLESYPNGLPLFRYG